MVIALKRKVRDETLMSPQRTPLASPSHAGGYGDGLGGMSKRSSIFGGAAPSPRASPFRGRELPQRSPMPRSPFVSSSSRMPTPMRGVGGSMPPPRFSSGFNLPASATPLRGGTPLRGSGGRYAPTGLFAR